MGNIARLRAIKAFGLLINLKIAIIMGIARVTFFLIII
jgi:hypothetical protein